VRAAEVTAGEAAEKLAKLEERVVALEAAQEAEEKQENERQRVDLGPETEKRLEQAARNTSRSWVLLVFSLSISGVLLFAIWISGKSRDTDLTARLERIESEAKEIRKRVIPARRPDAPDPAIDTVEPGEGPSDGGTEITIRGANFEPGVKVYVASLPARVSRLSANEIKARIPPAGEGEQAVRVVNPSGLAYEHVLAFTVLPPLTIKVERPQSMTLPATTGGDLVVIVPGLRRETELLIDGAPVQRTVQVVTGKRETELHSVIPGGQAGDKLKIAVRDKGRIQSVEATDPVELK
jgi:hypothetical protein